MGRRPNAIIAEWFSRGAKIEDASNRYAHTCRRCGEAFAKGRVEYLMQHLLKRCPNISDADRSMIMLQVQQTPTARVSRQPARANVSGGQYSAEHTQLPMSLERQQSALDTLAEVSRHHLDYSVQRQLPLVDSSQYHATDQDLAEQALWAQLQQHGIEMPAVSDSEGFNMSVQSQVQDPVYTSEPFAQGLVESMQASQHDYQQAHTAFPIDFGQLDPQLGNEAIAQYNAELTAEPVTAAAHNNLMAEQHPDFNVGSSAAQHSNETPVFIKYAPGSHEAITAGDAGPSDARTRPRGKFNESRRREVQEIRKRGACIRCRMLKKPCSEGTPCKTCATVEAARLWKGRCLRTKLSDEFSAWQVCYFTAHYDLKRQEDGESRKQTTTVDVEVRLGTVATGLISIPAQITSSTDQTWPDSPARTISIDHADAAIDQVFTFCISDTMFDAAVESESIRLISSTLREARRLCSLDEQATDDQTQNATQILDVRACYSLANLLLRNTIQLWIITVMLTSWKTHQDLLTRFLPVELRPQHAPATPKDVWKNLATSFSDDIHLQLLAMLERRAAKLSKVVLIDLERHLLQRQQVSGYTTFIAAFLLLHCVERMTHFYYRIDKGIDVTSLASDSSVPALSMTPLAVWSQGPSFAQLLQMLLRIRGLPPDTYEDEQGRLAVQKESTHNIVKLNGSVTEAQLRALDLEKRMALSHWLGSCDIDASTLHAWMGQEHAWTGKFIAGLLIPELMITDQYAAENGAA